VIDGNYVGLDVSGQEEVLSHDAFTNYVSNYVAIFIIGSSETTIGIPLSGNVIGSSTVGIGLGQANDVLIRANKIGTNALGSASILNQTGILVFFSEDVRIGGTRPQDSNLISGNGIGIALRNESVVDVLGNTIGLAADGSTPLGNTVGISLLGGQNRIGSVGAGNVISGNGQNGISGGGSSVIEGNIIGLSANGRDARGNAHSGILATSGGMIIRRNIISANAQHGINAQGYSQGTEIYGNIIGLTQDRSLPAGNGGDGIHLTEWTIPTLIGSDTGGGNVISGNAGSGVAVEGYFSREIIGNEIFGNGGLGIDLLKSGQYGVSPNEYVSWAPTNFPVLDSASTEGGKSIVRGSLHSIASITTTLHFYANQVADPSGHGEGEIYLGKKVVTTDDSANAIFEFVGPPLPRGTRFITATATNLYGTSEFSAALPATLNETIPALSPSMLILFGIALAAVAALHIR
jgi:hypothetical protein